ncbi:hypothetical protein RintRC_1871 [Richelia intracellularis]|nr:hypothetical protein RintRC_1871 [Richelia intracellularis]
MIANPAIFAKYCWIRINGQGRGFPVRNFWMYKKWRCISAE